MSTSARFVRSGSLINISLVLAGVGFLLALWMSLAGCEQIWIVRAGAWVSAMGALGLFAEWVREDELEHRKNVALEVAAHLGHKGTSDVERAIGKGVKAYRFPIVAVSALFLFAGSLLSGFGDLAVEPLIGWERANNYCTISQPAKLPPS